MDSPSSEDRKQQIVTGLRNVHHTGFSELVSSKTKGASTGAIVLLPLHGSDIWVLLGVLSFAGTLQSKCSARHVLSLPLASRADVTSLL